MSQTKLEYVQMRIQQLRTFLSTGNPVSSITVDGITVTYNRNAALQELDKLERQEAALKNPRSWFKKIDLS
jgi:hypothetical protein